jgi:NAD(P)-dependent dehydrogenase (short-subunit alcohol dehydrogenase family)
MGALDEERSGGLPITPVMLDVTVPGQTGRVVGEVLEKSGRIDALVNNAGISMFAAMEEVSDDDVKAMFEANVFGPVRLMRAVLPAMRSQKSGRILNVTSLAGYAPRPYQSVYSASKHALDAFSFCLGAEVREFGIRVVIIAPGRFKSESVRNMLPPSIDAGEPRYRTISSRKIDAFVHGSAGSDPVAVAEAIAACIESDDPPARLFVGADSQQLADQRRAATDDEYAALIAEGLTEFL